MGGEERAGGPSERGVSECSISITHVCRLARSSSRPNKLSFLPTLPLYTKLPFRERFVLLARDKGTTFLLFFALELLELPLSLLLPLLLSVLLSPVLLLLLSSSLTSLSSPLCSTTASISCWSYGYSNTINSDKSWASAFG